MKIRYVSVPLAATVVAAVSTPAMASERAIAVSSAAPVYVADQSAVAISATAAANDAALVELAEELETLPVTETAAAGSETITAPSTAGAAGLGAADLVLNASSSEAASAAVATSAAAAAQGMGGRSESFTVTLNQDAFFGFYPAFNGLIPVSDNVDFSFYGIIWTTPSFGTGGGNDLWTEFGIGANFILADGNLTVKPQVGLTNGTLLSGGVLDADEVPTGTGGNFADGIVPSLTINYSDDQFEAEFYGGYYAALRQRNEDAALDFLHTWVNAGFKFTDDVSAGAHYELLSNTRNTFPGGDTAVVYQWLGPYVQFSTDNGFFARFTAGADIEDGSDGDFYKLTAGFSF